MSKSNESFSDQVASDLGCCLLSLAWGAFAGFFALLGNALSTKPETQLRELGTPSHWGTKIVEVSCANCGATNESGAKRCRECGKAIKNAPPEWTSHGIKPATEDKALQWIAVVILLCLALVCFAQIGNL